MFGLVSKSKVIELEEKIESLKLSSEEVQNQKKMLEEAKNAAEAEKKSMKEEIEKLRSALDKEIAEKEILLNSADDEQKTERVLREEYENLKNIYKKKIQDFDDEFDEKVRTAAVEAAKAREALDKEISDARESLAKEIEDAKEKNFYDTTQRMASFSDSYGQYLSQITLMIGALNQAATNTFSQMFTGQIEGTDIKNSFDTEMLKAIKNADGIALDVSDDEPEDEGVVQSDGV